MKSYKFKMKLAPANFLCIVIYIFLFVISFLLKIDFNFSSSNVLLVFALILIYFFIHELLHGVGYYLGGTKSCNIKYGIALEKGILYTLCRQEISKFGKPKESEIKIIKKLCKCIRNWIYYHKK